MRFVIQATGEPGHDMAFSAWLVVEAPSSARHFEAVLRDTDFDMSSIEPDTTEDCVKHLQAHLDSIKFPGEVYAADLVFLPE